MTAVKQEPLKLSRRGRARATHWRIVKAAYALFCEHGYAGTTMAQIGEAAGVAVQTVYFAFHTKAALLSRTYDFAVMGEEEPAPPQQQPWWGAMVASPDITAAVRHFVVGVGEVTRRVAPLEMVARVAADGDRDSAQVVALHDRWQAEGYREALQILASKAPLRGGLSLDRATDLLLLFVDVDAYRVLVKGRGWSHQAWVDWTAAAVVEQLFDAADPVG